jgi:hypothetical protein
MVTRQDRAAIKRTVAYSPFILYNRFTGVTSNRRPGTATLSSLGHLLAVRLQDIELLLGEFHVAMREATDFCMILFNPLKRKRTLTGLQRPEVHMGYTKTASKTEFLR